MCSKKFWSNIYVQQKILEQYLCSAKKFIPIFIHCKKFWGNIYIRGKILEQYLYTTKNSGAIFIQGEKNSLTIQKGVNNSIGGRGWQNRPKSLFRIILNSQIRASIQIYNNFLMCANFFVIYNHSKLQFFLVYSIIFCISQQFCSQPFTAFLSDFCLSGISVYQKSEKVQQTDFRYIFVVFSCLYGFFFV